MTTSVPDELDYSHRKRRFFTLIGLSLLFILIMGLFVRSCVTRQPLTTLPLVDDMAWDIPPHYLFSVADINQPIGVAVSPDSNRIYVTERGGQRLIRVYERDGDELYSFSLPGSTAASRSPTYLLATDDRILVTDRLHHALFTFDLTGQPIDIMMSPAQWLSDMTSVRLGGQILRSATTIQHEIGQGGVTLRDAETGEIVSTIPPEPGAYWSPLGLGIDKDNRLYVTSLDQETHQVYVLDKSGTNVETNFGTSGEEVGTFQFPNAVVSDKQGRIYVSDSNNGRVQYFDKDGDFLGYIGREEEGGNLSLPRGLAIDPLNRLYVVDNVAQVINVYDLTGDTPAFLFTFGEFGFGSGQFNYPNDITIDDTGRIYITDTSNDRIQVWSY